MGVVWCSTGFLQVCFVLYVVLCYVIWLLRGFDRVAYRGLNKYYYILISYHFLL